MGNIRPIMYLYPVPSIIADNTRVPVCQKYRPCYTIFALSLSKEGDGIFNYFDRRDRVKCRYDFHTQQSDEPLGVQRGKNVIGKLKTGCSIQMVVIGVSDPLRGDGDRSGMMGLDLHHASEQKISSSTTCLCKVASEVRTWNRLNFRDDSPGNKQHSRDDN